MGVILEKCFCKSGRESRRIKLGKAKPGTAKVIETLMKITTILVPLVEVICIIKEKYYGILGGIYDEFR